MERQTVFALAGPTASGKTGLSIGIAHALNCEIICMDSMQIYRRMDIGTAKPTREEQDGVPHHMLDVVEPEDSFSVAQYQAQAEDCIREVLSRGRTPLLVGGTGLYLRALRQPMAMGMVGSDEELRAALQAQADAPGGKEELHHRLREVDPATADRLHVNDVRRVIRALEVYEVTGVPFSRQPQQDAPPPFDYRVAALTMDRAKLYDRVERRVDQMIAQGLEAEVRGLLDSGVPAEAQSMKGLGYKELVPYLRGECTLEAAVYAMKLGTRHYAKRQLTWFRREEEVHWTDSLSPSAEAELIDYFCGGRA